MVDSIKKNRIIFHIDMNCFFVSCEIAKNPTLKGKKVAVGNFYFDHKGIVLACSYEAKSLGIHAPMPFVEALRKCPDLIIVEPHMELYTEYSHKFFDYFLQITPLVEPGSIDEAYLDVTDVCEPYKVEELAKQIQLNLLKEFNLPCSIGIAPNKFLAKMASDMKKPLGITILRKREIETKLWPLPISEMFGVGKGSLDSFKALGIKTIGDLARYKDLQLLEDVLGKNNKENLIAKAFGNGSNEIDVNRFNEVSSISCSQTLDQDEYDEEKMLLHIKLLSNTLSHRLEKSQIKACTFTLQIKYFNFKLTSKSQTFKDAINDSKEIYNIMRNLFIDLYEEETPVRLFGVGASNFEKTKTEVKQLSFFDDLDKIEKETHIYKLIKEINKNIGFDKVSIGIKK